MSSTPWLTVSLRYWVWSVKHLLLQHEMTAQGQLSWVQCLALQHHPNCLPVIKAELALTAFAASLQGGAEQPKEDNPGGGDESHRCHQCG